MNMSALKQIHRCTRKCTRAPEHEERMHTPVRQAENERTPLRTASCEWRAPLCLVSDAFVAWPLQKSRLSSEQFECRLCSALRECQHPAGALCLTGASANLRYVELLVCKIVIILPFIRASSQQRKHRRATFKLDKIPVPSDPPKLALLVKMLVVDIALFWPLPPYKNLLWILLKQNWFSYVIPILTWHFCPWLLLQVHEGLGMAQALHQALPPLNSAICLQPIRQGKALLWIPWPGTSQNVDPHFAVWLGCMPWLQKESNFSESHLCGARAESAVRRSSWGRTPLFTSPVAEMQATSGNTESLGMDGLWIFGQAQEKNWILLSFTLCHSSAPGSSQLWEGPEQQRCWLDLALVKCS